MLNTLIRRKRTRVFVATVALLSTEACYTYLPLASAAAMQFGLGSVQPLGNALSLVELAVRAGDYAAVLSYCREKEDLLGFTAALVQGAK